MAYILKVIGEILEPIAKTIGKEFAKKFFGYLCEHKLVGVGCILVVFIGCLYREDGFQWTMLVMLAAFIYQTVAVFVLQNQIKELKSRIAILEQNTGSRQKKEEKATEPEAGNGSLLASRNETNGSRTRNVQENTGPSPGQENETEDTGMNQMVEEEPGNTPSKKYVKFNSNFNGYYSDLVQDLSVSSLCDHLFSLHLINFDEKETITRKEISSEQNRELLSILCKRNIPEDDFKTALEKTAQKHLIPKFFGNKKQ